MIKNGWEIAIRDHRGDEPRFVALCTTKQSAIEGRDRLRATARYFAVEVRQRGKG